MSRHSFMTLYSDPTDMYCHGVRMVLEEKKVTHELVEVDSTEKPPELGEINPYNCVPTLVDRNLMLFNHLVIMEYLDERFPYPPLLPTYPVHRANCRLHLHCLTIDWFRHVDVIITKKGGERSVNKARRELTEHLIASAAKLGDHKFFVSDTLSLVDCCVAPFFWRLEHLGIELPPAQFKMYEQYLGRVYLNANSFHQCMSDEEIDMRGIPVI